jgi:hypothetical protein
LLRIIAFAAGALSVAGFTVQAQAPAVSSKPPITASGRLEWFARSSVGPASLAGGVLSAAWGTMLNKPPEYGPHWEGFGDRYGMRLTGVVTGNAIEAGLGAIWGEDPRYPTAAGQPFRARVVQIVKMTFLARSASVGTMPAYARYAGNFGNNFLSNSWRESSEADVPHAFERVGFGFLGRMATNAFKEFWPSARAALRHKRSPSP